VFYPQFAHKMWITYKVGRNPILKQLLCL